VPMQVQVPALHELRLETGKTPATLRVVTGSLDILGQELLTDHPYTFTGTLFFTTFHGCTVELNDDIALQYTSTSNIERIFDLASTLSGTYNVVGHGRCTFLQTLCNLCVRMGKKVLISEIDPAQGFLVFPGVMGTMLVENLVCYDDDVQNEKLCYFYGDTEIKNREYYDMLSSKVLSHTKHNDLHLIVFPNENVVQDEESSDNFVVVGDERMFHTIKSRNKEFVPCHGYTKKAKTNALIYNYFHGKTGRYTPFILSERLRIYSVGEKFVPPTSALPLGAQRKMNTCVATPTSAEQDSIVAISYAKDEEEVGVRPVAGFVLIRSVQPLTFLCAQTTVSKDALYVQGNIKYSEF
ncbi:mRNA cleavage and polyadenylation factor IA/II complex, subunit CLP1, partial [Trachipleistophora hominis]